MTNEQWELLLEVIGGADVDPLPVGFIIDSPWLPGWAGMIDHGLLRQRADVVGGQSAGDPTVSQRHVPARLLVGVGHVHRTGEFRRQVRLARERLSVCRERLAATWPSWPRSPGSRPTQRRTDSVRAQTTAALPRSGSRQAGHSIKFAVARGPLNIAGFLAGNTELLMGIKTAAGASSRAGRQGHDLSGGLDPVSGSDDFRASTASSFSTIWSDSWAKRISRSLPSRI